ncbi:MAG: ABC transporter permease subunit [Comamonadaceae bacterium]|nr:ABC transporter permease subunit [Comamonadaceae bacterium]
MAALINAFFGTVVAWVLVRYDFPGRRGVDALIDFPFALPTAVAGLTLSNLFAANGWITANGWCRLVSLGTLLLWAWSLLWFLWARLFVVRNLCSLCCSISNPRLEAAATLGSSRMRTLLTIILPTLLPSIVTGFALALARAIGEYGSVVFISGNLPYRTEIAPVLITMRLEEYNYGGAAAIAVVLLVISFLMLICINMLELWASRLYSH